MEELTLEQEFLARSFMHKVTITGGLLTQSFVEQHKDTNIPEEILTEVGHEFAQKVIQKNLEEGTFDELYNDSWDIVVKGISDNFSITASMV